MTTPVTERMRLGWSRRLEAFRLRVSRTDAIPELCVLGVLSGALAAAVIITFRFLVELAQHTFLVHSYDFEGIEPLWRLVLAVGGGTVLGLLFLAIPGTMHRVGVTHIIERLDYHQGRLPWGNAAVQYVGGAVALTMSVLIFATMPYFDRTTIPGGACWRPVYRGLFFVFMADVLLLGYLGTQHPHGWVITASVIAASLYFAAFLSLPFVSKFEERWLCKRGLPPALNIVLSCSVSTTNKPVQKRDNVL